MIIFTNDANGKQIQVGSINANIFYKRVKKSKHLLVILNAWGIDKDAFDSFIVDCEQIRILDDENNIVYTCTPRHFARNAEVRSYGSHGQQYFLPLEKFKTEVHYPDGRRVGQKY